MSSLAIVYPVAWHIGCARTIASRMEREFCMTHVVVVGAGQAGASLVAKLRAVGFEGNITLIGAEKVPPYQRPPLSKAYLLGDMTEERLYLRPADFYADQNITLRLDT